jgi:hypothetical protein
LSDDGPSGDSAEAASGANQAAAEKDGKASSDPHGGRGDGHDGRSFRDAKGNFDSAGEEALERGRKIFRPGIEAFVRGGPGQRVHIGNRYTFRSGQAVAAEPGPVRSEVLTATRRRYARVNGYTDMMAALRERRLLILSGQQATGRSTTALRLLDELCGGAVSRLDPSTDLVGFDADELEEGRGYLGELPNRCPELTGGQADRLADLFRRSSCYLILIVPPDWARGEAFVTYGSDCPAPKLEELLDHHIRAQLRGADPDELEDTVLTLARSRHILDVVGPAPSVREAVNVAGLLVAHGRGEIALEQVEATCRQFVDRQVEEWFDDLRLAARGEAADKQRALTAFRLAVAVLHDMPRGAALQAAEELGERLCKVAQPLRTSGRELTAAPDPTMWSAARVQSGDLTITYRGGGAITTESLKFRDERYPQALLTHVWRRHHNLRPPIVDWLNALATDDRRYIQVCAAQAAGVLCWIDFPWTSHELLEPAACAEPSEDRTEDEAWQLRWFAALALDQAALDDKVYPIVRGFLREWRRRGSIAQRCTAALAYGYAIGQRSLDTTLVELRVLGTPQEFDKGTDHDEEIYNEHGDVIWAAGMSLARLLAAGAHHEVLERLVRWTAPNQRRSVQLLALQTTSLVTDLRVRHLSERQFAGGREDAALPARFAQRLTWPLMLALMDDDPIFRSGAVLLFRFALASQFRDGFAEQLGRWMVAAQDDAAGVDLLAAFLADLATEPAEYELLRHLVARRVRRWADPIRTDVATRLLAALAAPSKG